MTPKDKAKELTDKYIKYTPVKFDFENARQCALIAVDEIFEYAKYDYDFNEIWWKEVKQEIEKL